MALVRAHARPRNRARLHYELARRRCFAKWPLHGDALEMLRDGRLELGEHVLFEPGVWLTGGRHGSASAAAASSTSASWSPPWTCVEIGEHCMFANGCFITDADHRFDDPVKPVPWQGFTSQGPTRVGDNVWCGANVVITSGVTVGERCVIGANWVVTRDLPPHSIAVGAPARVIRAVELGLPSYGSVLVEDHRDREDDHGEEGQHAEDGEQRRRRWGCRPRGGPRRRGWSRTRPGRRSR